MANEVCANRELEGAPSAPGRFGLNLRGLSASSAISCTPASYRKSGIFMRHFFLLVIGLLSPLFTDRMAYIRVSVSLTKIIINLRSNQRTAAAALCDRSEVPAGPNRCVKRLMLKFERDALHFALNPALSGSSCTFSEPQ